MYPFEYEIIEDLSANVASLLLKETSDTEDYHSYELVYPDNFVGITDTKIYIAILMTDWINGIGKNSTFKQIIKQFVKFCKDAEKLKL